MRVNDRVSTELTVMPHHDLPPEMLDFVVDHLHNNTETLKQCCLVSKSWVPRTRKHLFAFIVFLTEDEIKAWKKAFPDPYNSPAYYTRGLVIRCPGAITTADGAEGGWIPAFSRLVRLEVVESPSSNRGCMNMNPAAFRKFPPTLKSLFVTSFSLPLLQVFDLIRSLPLLEDLALVGDVGNIDDDDPDGPKTVVPPSASPALTGTLSLCLLRGAAGAAHRLMNPPNCLHFRKLQLLLRRWEDLRYIAELVTTCSGTLESLDLTCIPEDEPAPGRIDLSKATKLQHIVLRCKPPGIRWATVTLETITSKHKDFQRVSFSLGSVWHDLAQANPDVGWPDLDRLLVRLLESHSIRTKLGFTEFQGRAGGAMELVVRLLPEFTKRGMIDLVEREPISYR